MSFKKAVKYSTHRYLVVLSFGGAVETTMVTAAYYPVNDTSLSSAERSYLQELEDNAAQQNLEQDLRPNVQALSIAFTVLATAVVGLRFIARQRQGAPYGADDWLILVSLVLLGGNLVFNIVMVNQGLGLHSGRLTLEQLELLNQVSAPWTCSISRASCCANTSVYIIDSGRRRNHIRYGREHVQDFTLVLVLPYLPSAVDPEMELHVRRVDDGLELRLHLRRGLPMQSEK